MLHVCLNPTALGAEVSVGAAQLSAMWGALHCTTQGGVGSNELRITGYEERGREIALQAQPLPTTKLGSFKLQVCAYSRRSLAEDSSV